MREIFCRGKRVDNGEWVYSSFIMQDKEHKLLSAKVKLFDGEKWRAVIPETFGQYTGLKDTNGKMIFDGDIVQWKDENFNNYTSVVEWCGEKWNYPAFDLAKHDYECNGLQYVHEDCIIEVIGTIYDNPELLEMKK